jgi:hypothetical protein
LDHHPISRGHQIPGEDETSGVISSDVEALPDVVGGVLAVAGG